MIVPIKSVMNLSLIHHVFTEISIAENVKRRLVRRIQKQICLWQTVRQSLAAK